MNAANAVQWNPVQYVVDHASGLVCLQADGGNAVAFAGQSMDFVPDGKPGFVGQCVVADVNYLGSSTMEVDSLALRTW